MSQANAAATGGLTEEEENEIWSNSVAKWKIQKAEKQKARDELIAKGITPPPDEEDSAWERLPIFMDSLPQGANPMLDAIQSITDECTPEELADSYKDQGNERFQLSNAKTTTKKDERDRYRQEAIYFYTKALDIKTKDMKRNSIYLSNRAAVNLDNKNYGKVIRDCLIAVEFNEANMKAYFRALKAMIALGKYTEAINLADRALVVEPENKDIKMLRDESVAMIEKARKREADKLEAETSARDKKRALATLLASKHMTLGEPFYDISQYETEIKFDGDDNSGAGHFPVLFFYPEYNQKDFVKDFEEGCTFGDHLEVMFEHPAPWDKSGQYILPNLEIYFQTNWARPVEGQQQRGSAKRWIRVKHTTTIEKVLTHPEYIIPGIPMFYILRKDTEFTKVFLTPK
ncbi:hypothetical protein SAMD00019534_035210 [Acytostelium subglobosum LB1]|uniref:hypothetical protein n=1 Tax=Acytostelium subglobosum LB1 TaxID=1410327 RepID=UPI000644CCEB|nr:hypothetical protein SAMD00019534_035210 [Acytostelium subglobosum LB1]GAM20346.1 hypothetical protein SAMD00019534_035210 [Acytostelium subglobosum LB1]|eukprot:XP_012759867.1 hypothetical protein SAMD00019534_035210 [Acytostelium subglobosum LB1]